MTPVEKEYHIFKAQQNQRSEDDRKRNRDIINDTVMKNGITTDRRITNMSDAYSEVRNNNHQQTEEEKDFIRFTSGSYVDCNK